MFSTVPSKEQLDAMYERYLQIWKGEIKETSTTETVIKKKTYLLGESRQEFTDKEAKEAFMAYMNKKATDIGMQNTTFVDAAGFYNRTTAYDLLKLAVYATAYDDLVDAWHKNTYTIKIKISMNEEDLDKELTKEQEKNEFKLTDKHLIIGGIVLGALLLIIIVRFIVVKINDRKIDKALDDL